MISWLDLREAGLQELSLAHQSPDSRARAGFIASHRWRGLFRSNVSPAAKTCRSSPPGSIRSENRTLALFYKNGSVAAELAAAGKAKDPLEVLSFKSSVKTKDVSQALQNGASGARRLLRGV